MVNSKNNTGINVKINRFNGSNNITTITANQYKNAALTAGVTNATIVTSAVPLMVLGARWRCRCGKWWNLKITITAARRNEHPRWCAQANKGTDGYTDSQLNNAVTGAKDMANKGDNLTVNQITNIVNNQLEQNNLHNSM